jgi:hypothetical protein
MVVSMIQSAKRNLSRLIARAKDEMKRLVSAKNRRSKRELGLFRGAFEVGAEFFEPLPPDELEGW